MKEKVGLTLHGRREGWFRAEEGAQPCAHSWVEVLAATLLPPQRATSLQQSQKQWNLCQSACYLQDLVLFILILVKFALFILFFFQTMDVESEKKIQSRVVPLSHTCGVNVD